jgi:hypothetical protein
MLLRFATAVSLAIIIGILACPSDAKVHNKRKTTKTHHKFPFHGAPPPHIHSKFAYVTWSNDTGYDIKVS